MTFEQLRDAVAGTAAALRARTRLEPAGGPGSKVFPPTYEGGHYAYEDRRLPGRIEPVRCVLLDSVQSQANRIEEALQRAIDEGRLRLPLIEVDFDPWFPGEDQPGDLRLLDPVGRITSLMAPHRIADAILRDSLLDGTPFRDSEAGRALDLASARNATPLYRYCPTALVLGMWDSTGPKGGLGAKFERAFVSEIVGIDAVAGARTSSRIDPLGIQLAAGPLYLAESGSWTLDEKRAVTGKKKEPEKFKTGRPSEVNHGNVTPTIDETSGGVTISHAEQTAVLSLPALRRLRFPPEGETWTASKEQHERDTAARTVLAALALCGAALAAEAGWDLRSRCLLWPAEPLGWELLGRPGEDPARVTVDAETAIGLLEQAVEQAKTVGVTWHDEPVILRPREDLVRLVVRSQQLAAQQGGEAAGAS